MTKPEDIAERLYAKLGRGSSADVETIRATISMLFEGEKARWEPAIRYFDRYCQDEADDVENCVCGEQQHADAKAFRDAIRSRKES